MPNFVLPTFNLQVNIWRSGGAAINYAAPDVQTLGNLSPGRRIMIASPNFIGINSMMMELLLPKLTDIRTQWNGTGLTDVVEVPAGSHRLYSCRWVDDIAKGFTNEHRIAMIGYLWSGLTWTDFGPMPAPVPLP